MSDTTEPNTAFPPGQQNSFHEWVDKLSYERNFDMDEVNRYKTEAFYQSPAVCCGLVAAYSWRRATALINYVK